MNLKLISDKKVEITHPGSIRKVYVEVDDCGDLCVSLLGAIQPDEELAQ